MVLSSLSIHMGKITLGLFHTRLKSQFLMDYGPKYEEENNKCGLTHRR